VNCVEMELNFFSKRFYRAKPYFHLILITNNLSSPEHYPFIHLITLLVEVLDKQYLSGNSQCSNL
jgi:hypothetical protein